MSEERYGGSSSAAREAGASKHREEPAERARRLLEVERAKFLDAIELVGTAYVATDPRGVVVDANAAASAMLGCATLADKLLIAFVARGDTHAFRRALGDLVTGRTDEVSIRLHLRKRGAAVFAARLSARVLRPPARSPAALRWIIEPD